MNHMGAACHLCGAVNFFDLGLEKRKKRLYNKIKIVCCGKKRDVREDRLQDDPYFLKFCAECRDLLQKCA